METKLNRFQTKAIRFCCGYSDDLRIKLPTDWREHTCYEKKVSSFLLENLLEIFGSSIYDKLGIVFNPVPGKDSEDYEKLLSFVEKTATNICVGETL